MIALIDDKSKNIACYGWKSTKTPHIIEEINKKFFDDGSILYDFRTLSNYKNKKLYKLLLSKKLLKILRNLYIFIVYQVIILVLMRLIKQALIY